VSLAAFRVFEQEIGIKPNVLLGHSFGGLTSYVCAGAISFADALNISRLKGKYSEEAISDIDTAMSSITGVEAREVRKICEQISEKNNQVCVGIVNSSNQVVIAGHEAAVKTVEEKSKKKGGNSERLRIKAPFHSSLLNQATQKIEKDLRKIKIDNLNFPILSAMTKEIYEGDRAEDIIKDLSSSLSKESFWLEPVEELSKMGVDLAIEIGPQKILTNLMTEIKPDIECLTFNKFIDLEVIKKRFGLDKESKIELMIRCLRIAVSTKNTNWDNEEYENGVVKPYRGVKNLLLQIRKEEKEPKIKDLIKSVEMLNSVLVTKKIPAQEQKVLWQEVFAGDCQYLKEILKAKSKFKFL
jgi:[acyl-carrier-protein] S-malonyltransferase